ncbi:MAG TPA: ABC transporter ATP-binding protein [Opitutaceae bacterium]|nr:ABC transporter ATP-binding protein [Opitutaceae bacterium]
MERSPNAPNGTILECRALARRFGETQALRGLDLEVRRGEIFGLVGPDGAGKTTTMRILAGVLRPTSGTVRVDNIDVAQDPEAVKEHIGYMSQRFGLYPDLTVIENIEFYADLYSVSRDDLASRIETLLGFSNLTAFKKRQAGNLSGGMKQKLGLACALIHTPKVLLLDEPTNGVDPVSRRDFWRILYQLVREGVTLFVSTAYLDEAERCNRLALLHQGERLGVGTPDEVKRLMRGSLWEILSKNPRETAGQLRHAIPDASVGLFGERVHLTLPTADKDEAAVRRKIEGAGVKVDSVRTISPSLEDVFVSVLGDRPEGSQRENEAEGHNDQRSKGSRQ